MIPNKLADNELPKNPKSRQLGTPNDPRNSDYYVHTTAHSLVSKYANGRKGLAINLNAQQIQMLEQLQEMFGPAFGWNEIICFAFHLVKKGVPISASPKRENQTGTTKRLTFKPSSGALFAILKIGEENSAERLIELGLSELWRSVGQEYA
jgi:hypothetical protein